MRALFLGLGGILGMAVSVQTVHAQPFLIPLSPQPQRNRPTPPATPPVSAIRPAPGADQPGDVSNGQPTDGLGASTDEEVGPAAGSRNGASVGAVGGGGIRGDAGAATTPAPPLRAYGTGYAYRPPRTHHDHPPAPLYYYPN